MTPLHDPTTRFSDRVRDYVRYRPDYPAELIRTLQSAAGLTAESVIADIGSGTGISSAPFLELGATVFAVEPNAAMREAAESRFTGWSRFHSQPATAEATGLPDTSIDLIVAGQAFHWFDRDRTRAEFRRILRPAGCVALFWNTRHVDTTPFLAAYEALLHQFSRDYEQVNHTRITPAVLADFFGGPFQTSTFPHAQEFDLEGFEGRVRSSSYVPAPGQPGFAELSLALTELFRQYGTAGTVRFDYTTELHFGPLTA